MSLIIQSQTRQHADHTETIVGLKTPVRRTKNGSIHKASQARVLKVALEHAGVIAPVRSYMVAYDATLLENKNGEYSANMYEQNDSTVGYQIVSVKY